MKIFYRFLYLLLIIFFLGFRNTYSVSWNKVTTIPPPYDQNYWLDINFLNSQYGWICGFNGMVIRTTDGGQTWAGSSVPFFNQLESIQFTSLSTGYTSGPQKIFKSIDGGVSWTDITPPTAIEIWGLNFYDDNNGLAVGGGCIDPQVFWKTTDGGSTWTGFVVDTVPNSGLTHVIMYNPNGLCYATSSGRLWKSLDGGVTWSVMSVSGPDLWQEYISNIGNSFLVPYAGLDCSGQGNNGGIHFTTDAGATWNHYSTGVPMFGTFLTGTKAGWGCGYDMAVYYTSDAGVTWQLKNCGIEEGKNMDCLWFRSPNDGWVVGEGVYRLGPDWQTVTKLNMSYGDVCIPGSRLDTVWVKNYSFDNAVTIATNLYGINFEDFSIVSPTGSFPVSACDSEMIIIQFNPKTTGFKDAKLGVSAIGGNSFIIDLVGNAMQATTKPDDTLLIINPAYCGIPASDSIRWTTNSIDNIITDIQKDSGAVDITFASLLPLNVYASGVFTNFTAVLPDTGWFTTRFKVILFPCLKDTLITVQAYGVSPILSADDKLFFNVNCSLETLDTLPIYNTGNSELIISGYNINQSNTVFSFEGWVSGRDFPITIKPGEGDSIIIKYSPSMFGSHNAVLSLINNDSTYKRGRKNPFYIALSGIIVSTNLFPKDTLIDLGNICIGDSADFSITIENLWNMTAALQKPVYNNKIYKMSLADSTFPIQLSQNDSIICRIRFKPDSSGQYLDTINIGSAPCNQDIKIVIKANCVRSELSSFPVSINEILQTGIPLKKTIKLYAAGNINLTIKNIYLKPGDNNWTINYSPNLPYNMNQGDSAIFDIEINALKDTIFKGNICFQTESLCPSELCIPLNLLSHSIWLTTSIDSINFETQKCSSIMVFDTISITNKGIFPDTIVQFELAPQGGPFSIVNPPTLPHIIGEGVKEDYIIEFNTINEGDFNANLIIDSKNLKGLVIKVPISSGYHTVVTKPDDVTYDFGNAEPCDDSLFYYFTYTNTGTLTDSLVIRKQNNLPGFDINPGKSFVIPAGDSIQIELAAIPSLFDSIGKYTENYLVTSNVCSFIHNITASINIIRPRLTIEPPILDFGEVWIDDSLVDYINVKNTSGFIKTITSINLIPASLQFKSNINLPVKVFPDSTIRIPITFTAKNEGNDSCIIQIIEESSCIDSTYIKLMANVPPEIYNTAVKIGNYRGVPGDTINIAMELLNAVPRIKPTHLDFKITYDKYLMFPINVEAKLNNAWQNVQFNDNGGSISGSLDSGYAENIFQNTGNILYFENIILKSYPDSTTLAIADFTPITIKKINITKYDGSLKVDSVCSGTGGFHLFLAPDLKTSLNNPVISADKLVILSQEPREQTVFSEIRNLMGDVVLRNTDITSKINPEIDIDISSLPNGVYFITLVSNYGLMKRYKFLIVR